MTLDEKIHRYTQELPHSYQEELFDFVQYLMAKAEEKEKKSWNSFSLSSALRDSEYEPAMYSISDIRERFS